MLTSDNATPQDIWSARLLVKMNNQDGIETPENIAEIAELEVPDLGTPEAPKLARGGRPTRSRLGVVKQQLESLGEKVLWHPEDNPVHVVKVDLDADGHLTEQETQDLRLVYGLADYSEQPNPDQTAVFLEKKARQSLEREELVTALRNLPRDILEEAVELNSDSDYSSTADDEPILLDIEVVPVGEREIGPAQRP